MINFFIPGKPVGKERPRFGKNGGIYTPEKTKNYEVTIAQLSLVARNAIGIFKPWENLVLVEMEIFCESKQSADIDNIIKSILDGMNKIIYHDDSQVAALDVSKYFDCEEEGVSVFVAPLVQDRSRGSKIACPACHSTNVVKNGQSKKPPKIQYICKNENCQRFSFSINPHPVLSRPK